MSYDKSKLTPDSSFRKLSKNDFAQTTDQWRERTLQRLGEVSGEWTAWVERDNIPTLPDKRPRPPVEPKTEDLMQHLKGRILQRRFSDLLKTTSTEGPIPTLTDVPAPTNYDAWEENEDLKSLYQRDLRDYERKEKLVFETFPRENKSVFPALISCISDASVQDLKHSPEGALFFDDHDAYNFFKLAIQEHDYLPPSMSSAAISRAKDEFEKMQQKPEDTLTEHINESRRRYENVLKIRGVDSANPYADFDLRDLLLRSLYKPVWASWISSRKANANLPTTFENLILALKQAESDMILEGPSIFDSFMPSAHATRRTSSSESSKRSSPEATKIHDSPTTNVPNCQCCGAKFYPKRPMHIRCDKCQRDFTAKQKEEKKKKIKSHSKGKTPKSKPFASKAHSTFFDNDSDDSEDSSDDETGPHASVNYSSFFCSYATSVSTLDEPHVYFDNCSNLNIIRDSELALNIQLEPVATKITGSIPGKFTVNHSADIGDLGRGCFNSSFSRNLISETSAIKAGYRITRDSDSGSSYTLSKDGRSPLTFTANAEGTFSIPMSRFLDHFRLLYGAANSTDVDRSTIIFTKRQRKRAALYHNDHQHSLAHCHHDRIIAALRGGLITNAPYTEADVCNAQVIYGPCPFCTRTKGTKHSHSGHYPHLPNTPGEYLAGDLFMIMGILFSIITCRLVKLRCITRLRNKGASEITRAIREAVNFWQGFGSKPRVLSWDQEPALVHSASEIWAQHGLRLDFTSPDSHERVAERDVRTIKEHVYASILGLNHAVDEEMVEGIVRDTVVLLNFLPNSETPGATPRTILDGERLNYARWSRVYAGQVAEFEIPYADHNKRGTRRELGYVIGHQGDNPIVRLLPHGKRLVIRSGHIKPVMKSAAIIRLIKDGISGAKRQRYNDLIAEINDFYGTSPDLPTTHEQPVDSPPLPDALPEFTFLVQPPPESLPAPSSPPTEVSDSTPTAPPISSPTTSDIATVEGRDQSPPEQRTPDTQAPPTRPPSRISRAPRTSTPPPAPASPRTLRPGARKPPGFYRKLASGESVSDYTACHLRATECERLYGATMTRAAAVTEVSNMIAARKAALPVDYRKLSKRAIREALPSFMFYKAKDETPEPLPHLLNKDDTPVSEGWTTVLSKKFKKKPNLKSAYAVDGSEVATANNDANPSKSASHQLLVAPRTTFFWPLPQRKAAVSRSATSRRPT